MQPNEEKYTETMCLQIIIKIEILYNQTTLRITENLGNQTLSDLVENLILKILVVAIKVKRTRSKSIDTHQRNYLVVVKLIALVVVTV